MKKVTVFTLVLLTILCFASYASADYSPRFDGRPDAFDPGNSLGYFIWQDQDGLHLRTSTAGKIHVFSGTIRTDGEFEDTFSKSADPDDSFRVSDDRDMITFQFTNMGDTSGIDLHVCDGTYVTFNLSMDGDEIDPADIYVGETGWHPGDSKFTIMHDDDPDYHYSDNRTVIVIGGPCWWWGPGWGWHHHHYGW